MLTLANGNAGRSELHSLHSTAFMLAQGGTMGREDGSPVRTAVRFLEEPDN